MLIRPGFGSRISVQYGAKRYLFLDRPTARELRQGLRPQFSVKSRRPVLATCQFANEIRLRLGPVEGEKSAIFTVGIFVGTVHQNPEQLWVIPTVVVESLSVANC